MTIRPSIVLQFPHESSSPSVEMPMSPTSARVMLPGAAATSSPSHHASTSMSSRVPVNSLVTATNGLMAAMETGDPLLSSTTSVRDLKVLSAGDEPVKRVDSSTIPFLSPSPKSSALSPSSTHSHRHHRTIVSQRVHDDLDNDFDFVFNWKVFVLEFVIHLLNPLAVPFVYCIQGKLAVKNRQLNSFNLNTVLWLLAVVSNIAYYADSTQAVQFSEVFLATMMFLGRNTVISVKYAFFSPRQNSIRITQLLSNDEIANRLLVLGWRTLKPNIVDYELGVALARSKLDLAGITVSLDSIAYEAAAIRDEAALLPTCDEVQPFQPPQPKPCTENPERMTLGVQALLSSILNDSSRCCYYSSMIPIAFALVLPHIAIPYGARLFRGDNFFGSTWADTVCIVCSTLLVIVNFTVNILFMLIGVLDYNRRIFCMHQLSSMLIPKYKIRQTQAAQVMPLLDFFVPHNLLHWFSMRSVLKEFGFSFFLRIQTSATVWGIVSLAYVSFLVFPVIFSRSIHDYSSVAYALYDAAVFLLLLVCMIVSAQELNGIHAEHRRILTLVKTMVVKEICELEKSTEVAPSEEAKVPAVTTQLPHLSEFPGVSVISPSFLHSSTSPLSRCLLLLRESIELMEIEDLLRPVKILGFDANQNFYRAILGLATSAALAGVKLVLFN